MKKHPLVLIYFLILSGCTKTPVDVQPQDDAYPIVFEDVRTKTLMTDFNLTAFRVWGETSPGAADVFDGAEVTGVDPDEYGRMDNWEYEGDKYWLPEKTYDFYAVAPLDIPVEYASGDYGFEYAMPDNISTDLEQDNGHIDVIAAHHRRRTGAMTQNPPDVNLEFGHKLARISINLSKSALNNSHTMKVKNIYLWGMKKSGTYRFASGWTTSDEAGAVSLTDIDLELPANAVPVTIGGIYAVPQALSADQVNLLVEYTYSHGTNTSSRILSAVLPVDVVSEWSEGNNYTYSAVLFVEQDIRFDTPVVEPWGTEQVGGTIIIR